MKIRVRVSAVQSVSAGILSAAERERAAGFRREADRAAYVGAHVLLRTELSRADPLVEPAQWELDPRRPGRVPGHRWRWTVKEPSMPAPQTSTTSSARSCSPSHPLLDLGGELAFDGPVRTVKCYEDNSLLKSVLSTPGEVAVLVIDGAGSLRRAVMGDMIAALAVENGWSGVVINSAVRDVAVLRTLPLGIKALGSNPRKSTRTGQGSVDVPVEFGGVTFRPGTRLVADEDGVLVER